MVVGDKKYCILCEADGEDNIEAEYFVNFYGDLIPVCEKHNKLIKSNNLVNILDEEPGE